MKSAIKWILVSAMIPGFFAGTWWFVDVRYGDQIKTYLDKHIELPDRFDTQEDRISGMQNDMQSLTTEAVITGGRYRRLIEKIDKLEVNYALSVANINKHTDTQLRVLRNNIAEFGKVITKDLSRNQEIYVDLLTGLEFLQGNLIGQCSIRTQIESYIEKRVEQIQ